MIKIGIIGNANHLNTCRELFPSGNDAAILFELIGPVSKALSQVDKAVTGQFHVEPYDGLLFFNFHEPNAQMAIEAIRMGKHIFLEHPAILKPAEMSALLENVKEANVMCACGSEELFHPAFVALHSLDLQPQLIESRYSRFQTTKTERQMMLVDVFRHLALIMKLVNSDVKRIQVNELSVRGSIADVVSVRLEFSNGCVTNMLIDQTGTGSENRIQIYEHGRMSWIDLQKQDVGIRMPDERSHQFISSRLSVELRDPFQAGLQNFFDAIQGNASLLNPLRDNAVYLETAMKIFNRINSYQES